MVEFAKARDARSSLGRVRTAFARFEQATKAQIAQSIFDARINDRITVSQELLGALGDVQYAVELCALVNDLPLDDYMVMVRGTAEPDPSLFVPTAVDAEVA